MKYKFYTCDVFSKTRFGGNQLAVLPDARGLSPDQMQQIAREFNYSESTFVFPATQGNTRHVRIFTPTTEVPFAGHPNVGTAFTLATIGAVGSAHADFEIVFEEQAGLVPIRVSTNDAGDRWCELRAPLPLSLGKSAAPELAARVLSLGVEDILTDEHQPTEASVGLPFLIVQVRDINALARARINMTALDELVALDLAADVHVYTRSDDGFDLRARMFAPLDGVVEDPATGSANCALAGLLARLDSTGQRDFCWRIAQGVEMGRPSELTARAQKESGRVTGTWIGGDCVMVSEGMIEV